MRSVDADELIMESFRSRVSLSYCSREPRLELSIRCGLQFLRHDISALQG